MKQKIQINKEQIRLPDDMGNIHYQSKRNDKVLQNKLSLINNDHDILVDQIKSFIEQLVTDTRTNDEFLYEKIYKSLENILEIAKNGSFDNTKIKNKILNEFNKIFNNKIFPKKTQLKTKITEILNEIVAKQNGSISDKSQNNKNKKQNKKSNTKQVTVQIKKRDIKNIYRNILTSSIFTNKATKKIRSTAESIRKKIKISNIAPKIQNKKRSKRSTTFNHRKFNSGLYTFLKKYNTTVIQILKAKKKQIDKGKIKKYTLFGHLKNNIETVLKRKIQLFKRFVIKINPVNWYKKFKKKFRRQTRRHGLFLGSALFMLAMPFKIFGFLWKTFKFVGKISGVIVRTTFKILKGIFKLVTKTLGIAFKIFTKVFSLTFKISKFVFNVVKKLLNPLKYLKIFLCTPQGAYITGFIAGFLTNKIVNEVSSWIVQKSKDAVYNVSNAIIEKHKKLSNQENVEYEKDIFGIPRLNKHNFNKLKHDIQLKLFGVLTPYAEVIVKEQTTAKEKFTELKKLLDSDLNKFCDLVGITFLKNKVFDISKSDLDNYISTIDKAITGIQNNDFFKQLDFLAHVAGTGFISSKMARETVPPIAGKAIAAGGVLIGASIGAKIGSVFPIVGTVIGGLIGGALGAITEHVMTKEMRFKLGTKALTQYSDIAQSHNRIFGNGEKQTLTYVKRLDKLNAERRRKYRLGEKDVDKWYEKQLNELEKDEQFQQKHNGLNYRFVFKKRALDRLNSLTQSDIVMNRPELLVNYILTGKKQLGKKTNLPSMPNTLLLKSDGWFTDMDVGNLYPGNKQSQRKIMSSLCGYVEAVRVYLHKVIESHAKGEDIAYENLTSTISSMYRNTPIYYDNSKRKDWTISKFRNDRNLFYFLSTYGNLHRGSGYMQNVDILSGSGEESIGKQRESIHQDYNKTTTEYKNYYITNVENKVLGISHYKTDQDPDIKGIMEKYNINHHELTKFMLDNREAILSYTHQECSSARRRDRGDYSQEEFGKRALWFIKEKLTQYGTEKQKQKEENAAKIAQSQARDIKNVNELFIPKKGQDKLAKRVQEVLNSPIDGTEVEQLMLNEDLLACHTKAKNLVTSCSKNAKSAQEIVNELNKKPTVAVVGKGTTSNAFNTSQNNDTASK